MWHPLLHADQDAHLFHLSHTLRQDMLQREPGTLGIEEHGACLQARQRKALLLPPPRDLPQAKVAQIAHV